MASVRALLLCVVAFAASAAALDELKSQFIDFMLKYNKNYASDEERDYRFKVFNETLTRVALRNAEGGATYGINKFSDLTTEEFRKKYLMHNYSPLRLADVPVAQSNIQAPETFDWRTKGAVTPVKNQEQCGSCWAFSATETIESVWILAGNSQQILAPQQIVDCDTTDSGCNGGRTESAFDYVISAGGQEDEQDYPYQGQDGQCQFNAADVKATIKSWQYATTNNDEQTLQSNLASMSPLSICVDASQWQDYSNGVMMGSQCTQNVDHCVQLVGYNAGANPPYWIVRNSWDTTWGIDGYIWLQMWQNTCAMASDVTVPAAGGGTTSSTSSTSSSGPTGSLIPEDEEEMEGGNAAADVKPSAAFLAA